MKRRLRDLIYGILLGISCIMPGFSGGTMLLILGIYPKITNSLANIIKHPLKEGRNLFWYGIGSIIGVIIGTTTIALILNKAPLAIASFFVGLVGATLIIIFKDLKQHKMKFFDFLVYLIFLALGLVMAFSNEIGFKVFQFSNCNILTILLILVIASIASATMIVPAASGMTILLIFGMYDDLIMVLQKTFVGIIIGNGKLITSNLWFIIPFVIGIIIGIVGISKIISYILNKHASTFWYAITALLFVSPLTIYKSIYEEKILPHLDTFYFGSTTLILCIVSFLIGFLGLILIAKKAPKK